MNKNYPLVDLQNKFSASQKVFVFLPANPRFDQVAGALSLYVSLTDSGKNVLVICPTPMMVEFNHLVGVDKIVGKTKGTDLVVSFNYPVDQIEKVSYNDDGGKPNVVFQPKAGAPSLSENLVNFSYAGMESGLVITVGLRNLSMLPKFDQEMILKSEIVNIDVDQANEKYGAVNVIDPEASGISEVVLGVILGVSLAFGQDAAQNILSGIWQSTNLMTGQNIGPDTYESVAICLRTGAIRPQDSSNFNVQRPKVEQKTEPLKEEKKQIPPVPGNKPPADWFEPKIFKGSSIA